MMDINDSESILTVTLSKIELVQKVKKLTFSISKVHKGKINVKSIFHNLDEENRHVGETHHIDTVFIGQEWIIFGSSIEINDKQIFKLSESNSLDYCMLSRPVVVDDPYLPYIDAVMSIPNSTNKEYYNNMSVSAIGSLNNKTPLGTWKYYTRHDLHHYWEGEYIDGKRDGLWQELAMNYKNEKVVINEEEYAKGVLKERTMYNYIREKKCMKHLVKRLIQRRYIVIISFTQFRL